MFLTSDGFLTLSAEGSSLRVIMNLTVRLTVVVIVISVRKGNTTDLLETEMEGHM